MNVLLTLWYKSESIENNSQRFADQCKSSFGPSGHYYELNIYMVLFLFTSFYAHFGLRSLSLKLSDSRNLIKSTRDDYLQNSVRSSFILEIAWRTRECGPGGKGSKLKSSAETNATEVTNKLGIRGEDTTNERDGM